MSAYCRTSVNISKAIWENGLTLIKRRCDSFWCQCIPKSLDAFLFIDKYPNGDFHYHYNPDYVLSLRHLLTKLVFHWKKQKNGARFRTSGYSTRPKTPHTFSYSEVEPQGSGLYVIIPNPQIIAVWASLQTQWFTGMIKGRKKYI